MADATETRSTHYEGSALNQKQDFLLVPADSTVPGGVMVCENADGEAVNPAAANAATQVVKGVTKHYADNTDGASGDVKVNLRTGVHGPFALDATNPPTQADVQLRAFVYAVDNQTVSKTAADGPKAGRIVRLDDNGAWVDIGAL